MAGYITVLIQKSNPEGDWGFSMGPSEPRTSVVITQVEQSCVAAELLEAGDRIIELEGMDTNLLTKEELAAILGNPSKRLSMVVLKKNPPKESKSVRKVTERKVTEIVETKEEEEKRKEYEVVLEVSPRSSLDDALRTVKEKLDRGEQLDEKEMNLIATYNKTVQKNTTKYDATRRTTEKGTVKRPPFFSIPRNAEIQKRKEKFLKEQLKEETITIEQLTSKKEMETMEEKKKKSSSFWTEPPSDLKKAIQKNQFWQTNQTSEPITTSALFSHLNDLHNEQRKTTAQEEKRQFWESCRKKYGLDPPETKYDLAHRLRTQDDLTRSRSCEPEHLDSNKASKERGKGFRDTNPFFSPAPTNPFYEECRSHSEEYLTQGHSKGRNLYSGMTQSGQSRAETSSKLSDQALDSKEESEKHTVSSEANREDFASKCEFFERATAVPTTSCAKNAQDIVSEHMGTNLKKPSDFINEMKLEQNQVNIIRSTSREEKLAEESKLMEDVQKQRYASLESQQTVKMLSEEISSLQQQTESTLQTEQGSCRKTDATDSTKFKQAESHGYQEKQVAQETAKSKSEQIQLQEHSQAESKRTSSFISDSVEKNITKMEAQMNESIEKIISESEKLRSLNLGAIDSKDFTPGVFDQSHQVNIIPDTTAFPGLQPQSKMTTSISGEFQKRSFVETSYEKVTKTGTPFENVESAWRREFRVATPSGFYDNNTEEVFKQEARTEGFREMSQMKKAAEDYVDQAFREITRMEGAQPTYEYNAEFRSEGLRSGESRESSGSMIHGGPK